MRPVGRLGMAMARNQASASRLAVVSGKAMAVGFVHLHVNSQYSFLTTAVKLSDLPGKAKALGMRGVALTDVANMYGAIRHYKGCKDKGLTPLLGCEVFVPRTNATGAVDHLVLLAAN